MRISKSAQRTNGEEVITDLKTPKSKRTIMLPDFLIRELKAYFLKIEYFSEDEQIFPKCKTYFNKEMERGIKKVESQENQASCTEAQPYITAYRNGVYTC